VHDHLIVVEHQAAHTRTEENFRGIAGGRARIGFNGLIIVRAGADHADSAQSLKGLLAGSDAEIDLRPQLQIHTDEVRCSHGATTGKLDDTMLFYLLTRGIEPEVAQRLLKWAFITDVVAHIDVPALRTYAQRSLARRMQDARSLEDLLS
jgi:Fe-S cluster assembly protein SufD